MVMSVSTEGLLTSVGLRRFARQITPPAAWSAVKRLVPLGKGVNRASYAAIVVEADYSPWLCDVEFLSVWEQVRHHTLVDVMRCWELWCLVEQAAKVPGAILEVGTWRGGTAGILGVRAKRLGLTEPLYVCDTFAGVVKASARDGTYKGGEHADASADDVRRLLTQTLGLEAAQVLVGVFPDETGVRIPEGPLRLCHIDVDVYESARGVLAWAWPRLSGGGLVVFDDYGFSSCPGVTDLVNEMRSLPDRIVLHNVNGHALVMKRG